MSSLEMSLTLILNSTETRFPQARAPVVGTEKDAEETSLFLRDKDEGEKMFRFFEFLSINLF
ncbi:hypothetical protein GCM10007906_27410 [Vibrio hyugaensis]|uniref:Uncharacterized protein n=1 Tax=Vibrio hyugaensis TaxID=1534743 RepID=A0ABQ5Y3X2_9VIBR|nr:hypothetical protein GCM10007906_27410 [Vibrio hyugaensis]